MAKKRRTSKGQAAGTPQVGPNYLLGNGHRLTEPVSVKKRPEERSPAYGFEEARGRLAPQFESAAATLSALPELACPEGYSVAILTLHPESLAKSYFPQRLLREARMEAIGSRPSRVHPAKWAKKAATAESPTTDLFVAALRDDFELFARELPQMPETSRAAPELTRIEVFRAPLMGDRVLQPVLTEGNEKGVFEAVLHLAGGPRREVILEAFRRFSSQLGFEAELGRRFEVQSLCFLPLQGDPKSLGELSKFSFLRTIRDMPRLRPLDPVRSGGRRRFFAVSLPEDGPLDPQLRAAVFDGGFVGSGIPGLVASHEVDGLAPAVVDYVAHGTAVTSALMFGPLDDGTPPPRPFGMVDHYRVLDDRSEDDPYELYDVLTRIQNVLQSRRYNFVNLSIGPALPVEDNDVHPWTAVLDDLLKRGETLLTVAVGNNGELDREAGVARIQVPSDSVNSLAVGAADSRGEDWGRAPYSALGPGRSPGLVRPEVVAFGGGNGEHFHVLDTCLSRARPESGTSFAAPLALRMGMGIRAHFGEALGCLAIKALLVHAAHVRKGQAITEVGFGRIPQELDSIVVCPDGTARIVYQGELRPGQYLRTPIPLPVEPLPGMVGVQATFCFACGTDPTDPGNYTRGGLDVTFRPHDQRFDDEESRHPKTRSFFRQSDYQSERSLRRDAHKWETTLHRRHNFQGTSLRNPVFDVHYQAREGGHTAGGSVISYALVVTIESRHSQDLYNRIVQRYQTILEPLVPVIAVPVRV